ncbi:MAG: dihydrofolate reductase family protein [Verrucomicrobiota bacterium]
MRTGQKKGARHLERKPGEYPFVFLNVAMTADGKIAPANRDFEPFSSPRDREYMMVLRARADAVMSGARTLDLMPVKLGVGGEKYRRQRLRNGLAEKHVRVVVSGSATIDPNAEIFKHRFSPILVLACGLAPEKRLRTLRRLADEVAVFGENEIDFRAAFRWLKEKWKVERLLCEGGGEVNGALFEQGLVDEVYLTICPLIFGGRTAPTIADGQGVERLADATLLEMKSMKRYGDELFLVYRVKGRGGISTT